MDITAVASATLSTIAYDGSRNLLQLEFRSGAVYHYFGVPAVVQEALLGAPSKGSYFNQAIRGRYLFVRVSGLQAGAPGEEYRAQGLHGGGAPWPAR
ncbi:MAG TPA: KTSC domain-containing protein [Terriglobales bacterium]|nr:KTSC domain-containing protein [Terriglobales bacterium]